MAKEVKQYMVKVYAYLVKRGKRELESLPTEYQDPVAEHLAANEEG